MLTTILNTMATPSECRAIGSERDHCCVIRRERSPGRSTYPLRHSSTSAIPPRTRPRPGRRRCLLPTTLTVLQLSFYFMVLLSTFCVPAGATRSANGRRKQRFAKLDSGHPRWEAMQPDLNSFQPGDIVYDRRFPVMPLHNDLYRRQDGVNVEGSSKGNAKTTADRRLRFSSTSTAKPAAATFTPVILPDSRSSSSSSSSTSAEPTSIVSAPVPPSTLPRPFDTGLGNNYTQESCPSFINNFLRNETFTSCLPFSLLLQVAYPVSLLHPNLANRCLLSRIPCRSSPSPNPTPPSPAPSTQPANPLVRLAIPSWPHSPSSSAKTRIAPPITAASNPLWSLPTTASSLTNPSTKPAVHAISTKENTVSQTPLPIFPHPPIVIHTIFPWGYRFRAAASRAARTV